jgi:hypothetical protein
MSPAERATLAELSRLATEVARDRGAMRRCGADAAAALGALRSATVDRSTLIVGAVGLHGWYTALETILERVARAIDASVPTGPTSHRDLLSQGMTEVEGMRPAVLDRALEPELLALLTFRHFFRHAYGVELDPARLRVELERHERVAPQVDADLAAWSDFLEAARRRLVP